MSVVIITTNKYPDGDAGAYRQHMFAKMITKSGRNAFVVGFGPYTGAQKKVYDDIPYISMRCKLQSKCGKIWNALFLPHYLKRSLRQYTEPVEAFLVIDVFPRCFRFLKRYAKRKQIKLVHDSVEWYSPEEFPKGEKDLAYKLKDKLNTKLIDSQWNVIAISNYLLAHFQKIANQTVRIPVVMDAAGIEAELSVPAHEKCVFVYAGGPGRKDYLKQILEGFLCLSDEKRKQVEFHIIGVNEAQLINTCGIDSKTIAQTHEFLHAHGRVPHAEAVRWVKKADFTVFVRDEQLRYAKAGFPTKVVESLACGTPPICNYSSDLRSYLKDNENALIVDGHAPQDVAAALVRAINLSQEQKNAMRQSARETAEECFDYNCYIDELNSILS